jgi:phage gpG-like protein
MSAALDASAVQAALQAKVDQLTEALLAKVETNLSGEVLQTRSGTLKASIVAETNLGADVIAVTVASRNVPYAAIQEHGGVTAPHDIVPVKARALAFAGVGGQLFARAVHHPGSRIPARSYLGSALDALHDEILGGLKEAVLAALQAD